MATVYGAGASRRLSRGGRYLRSGSVNADKLARGVGRAGPTSVNSLIQEQIIPRLLQVHTPGVPRLKASGVLRVAPEDAASFVSLPLMLEADELLDVVEGFIASGVSVESVFVDLLAASARRLGQHWEEDECDFLVVTMGLWRIQEVMRQVASHYPAESSPDPHRCSALFSPMPGDEHSFGALMVEEVFARAGWLTEALINPKRLELLKIVADKHFDLIGLTVTCDCPNAILADLISAIRSVSRATKVQILIGGYMVNANPGVVNAVGADGTATEAGGVLALAEKLVRKSARFDIPLV